MSTYTVESIVENENTFHGRVKGPTSKVMRQITSNAIQLKQVQLKRTMIKLKYTMSAG